MRKLTETQEKHLKQAIHANELEGFTYTEKDKEIIKSFILGEISKEEMIKRTLEGE